MITVRLGNGDTTEAETSQAALAAARTSWDEADWRGCRPRVTFAFENGEVWTVTSRRLLDVGATTEAV